MERAWPPLGLALALALLTSPRAAAAADDAAPSPTGSACPSARCGRVIGEVRVAGQRTPLPDAVVIVMPAPARTEPGPQRRPVELRGEPAWARSQRSDADGRFRFDDVPAGRVLVAVLAPGFDRREHVVQLEPQVTAQLRVFVPPQDDNPFRTVVSSAPPPRAQVTERLLSKQEIATLPGSQGDPLRALQNLPGVARPPAGLGLLVIRGAAPSQSAVFLGGHAMPRAFHILSLASVFPADVLDELRYVPGNFDAAYGNATGGVVVVEPRRGRRDGVHGFGEIDLAAAGAMVEGPLGKGSFIVGAQRAYVDGVLATGAAVTERVTGEPSSLLLPRYYDYQALFDHPLPDGGWISARSFGSGDVLRARNPPGIAETSSFELRSDFHRVDLAYRKTRHGFTVRLTPSFRYEIDRLVAGLDTFRRRRRDYVTSARAELSHAIGRRAELTLGTDFEVDRYAARDEQADLTAATPDPSFIIDEQRGVQSSLGLYASAELRLGPLTLRPGARASAFTVDRRYAFAIDPRVVAHLQLGDRWRLSAGLGRYSQARAVADRNEIDLVEQGTGIQGASVFLPSVFGGLDPAVSFAPLETELRAREALHASVGARVRWSEGRSIELTGFLRDQNNNNPPVFDGLPNPFSSTSRSLGAEALVRQRLTNKLYGWLGYTLLFAELIFDQAPVGFPVDRRPSDYDQRHNLVALLSYGLPRRWRIGGRFRLVTGFPYTPVIGSVAVTGGYQPIFGRRNTARLPVSHQLDLRIDKRWVRDRASITAYFDLQNVYNRVNPELVLYAADFRREAGYVGLPIFPSLGVRVDW